MKHVPPTASLIDDSPESTSPTHEEVAAAARALWEEKGRPANQDGEIWIEAERRLKGIISARMDEERLNPKNLRSEKLGLKRPESLHDQ